MPLLVKSPIKPVFVKLNSEEQEIKEKIIGLIDNDDVHGLERLIASYTKTNNSALSFAIYSLLTIP